VLNSEGISAVIADEHIVSSVYTNVPAFGGVKLQVREEDAGRAREILEKIRSARTTAELEEVYGKVPEDEEDSEDGEGDYEKEYGGKSDDEEPEICPQCGSDFVYKDRFSPGCGFAPLLFFTIPVPVRSGKWHCSKCGNRWESREYEKRKGTIFGCILLLVIIYILLAIVFICC
jgi:hypothetical protein